MDIKQLKRDAANLQDIEDVTTTFEENWIKPIRKNTNNQFPFLNNLSTETKKDINQQLATLNNVLHEVKYGQIINEKIASLAHNLVELKIAVVTNDHKKAKRLLNMFLKDKDTKLHRLIFEVPFLESQIGMFNQAYDNTLEQINQHLPLEHSIQLMEGKHKQTVSQLHSISQQQKQYLSAIGKNFVTITRNAKKNKEFRKLF